MPTLTRSVGPSAREHGTVFPINRLNSISVFSTRNRNRLFLQKLNLRPSPIGGLEISWNDLEELEETERSSRFILDKTLEFHENTINKKSYNYRVNEPELWIPKSICEDLEIWTPLMLEAFVAGIGHYRKELMTQIDLISVDSTGTKLVGAYRMHNFRIDPLFAQLMRTHKDQLMNIAKSVACEPHGSLGMTWNHVRPLAQKEIKRFKLCRPFWATDLDKLEELLQIPPSEIFGFCRGVGCTWTSSENACVRAAENLGYTIPQLFEDAPAQQPALVEVKPSTFSNVKDRKHRLMTSGKR
jgi:hypothetical protein